MKKLVTIAVALVTLVCLGLWGAERLAFTEYMAKDDMKGKKFWAGRARYLVPAGDRYFPLQIPGPADQWARGEPKRVEIESPYAGRVEVVISLYDSHESAPPGMRVLANGREVQSFKVPKGKGVAYPNWSTQGKPWEHRLLIPPGMLEGEKRLITIATTSGSWVAVKKLTLRKKTAPWVKWAALIGLAWLAASYAVYLTRRKAWKRHIINACVILASTALTLVAAEFLLRWFFPQREYVPQLRIAFEPDEDIGFKLKPNVKTTLGFDTNHLGLRDYQRYSRSKPQGVYRIICLGDSFTFSITSMPDSYPKQLENILEKQAKKKTEVLNCGITAYGTDNEYHFLKKVGLGLEPDLVLVGLYVGNDISDNYAHPSYTAVDGVLVRIEKAKQQGEGGIKREKAWKLFWDSFHLVRLLRNLQNTALYQAVSQESKHTRVKMNQVRQKCVASTNRRIHMVPGRFEPAYKEGWDNTLKYLGMMHSLCKERGVGFGIVLIPDQMQFETPEVMGLRKQLGPDYDWGEPQASLMRAAEKGGWQMLNALEPMQRHWKGGQIFYCGDTHFNEAGNRLLAQVMAQWLRRIQPGLF